MISVLQHWYQRTFSDPQAVVLALLLLLGFGIVMLAGDVLTPVIAAVVIAYVLEGAVKQLQKIKVPRLLAVVLVVVSFIFVVMILFLGLVPLFSKQLAQFFTELPNMIAQWQGILKALPEKYPFISELRINEVIASVNSELAVFGQKVVSISLASAVNLFTVLVYMVVVPLLVFFFLKDKTDIIQWIKKFLPESGSLVYQVWWDVDKKIGRYIRGKLIEVLVVGVATYIPLRYMDMNYAALLSFLVGLSVIIPYVGAVAVTIPVALIAYFQFGNSSEFVYLMLAYGIVQFLDGNLLVPLLFSEVVNMHPAAIIISVLVFGGLWGVWGVFFAIPLASLIQAVITAWPQHPLSVNNDV